MSKYQILIHQGRRFEDIPNWSVRVIRVETPAPVPPSHVYPILLNIDSLDMGDKSARELLRILIVEVDTLLNDIKQFKQDYNPDSSSERACLDILSHLLQNDIVSYVAVRDYLLEDDESEGHRHFISVNKDEFVFGAMPEKMYVYSRYPLNEKQVSTYRSVAIDEEKTTSNMAVALLEIEPHVRYTETKDMVRKLLELLGNIPAEHLQRVNDIKKDFETGDVTWASVVHCMFSIGLMNLDHVMDYMTESDVDFNYAISVVHPSYLKLG